MSPASTPIQDTQIYKNTSKAIVKNLIINTNREGGLNFTSRISHNQFKTSKFDLFYDFILGGGVSYNIPIEKSKITPYVVSQFNILLEDLGTYKFTLKPAELTTGIIFDNGSFSIEPNYTKRIWEQELGINTQIRNKNFKGYLTESSYEFCPDKWGVNFGSLINLDDLEGKINYEINSTNYDGEKEYETSLNIAGSVRF